jgi:WD40 repeat protein
LTTTLADHLGPILDGRFSDDGQLAITASEDHTARLWEIPGGAPLGGPLRHLGPVHSVDLTRDAKWAVTASEDKTARVWEVMTSQPMGMIVRHEAALVHAEFDPTDTWFLTASKDGVVRISEVATGHPVCEFAQPGHSLRQATFSPDGKWVLIASDGWATIRRVLRHSGPIPRVVTHARRGGGPTAIDCGRPKRGPPSRRVAQTQATLANPSRPGCMLADGWRVG